MEKLRITPKKCYHSLCTWPSHAGIAHSTPIGFQWLGWCSAMAFSIYKGSDTIASLDGCTVSVAVVDK
jgi:hypothetical protein